MNIIILRLDKGVRHHDTYQILVFFSFLFDVISS